MNSKKGVKKQRQTNIFIQKFTKKTYLTYNTSKDSPLTSILQNVVALTKCFIIIINVNIAL